MRESVKRLSTLDSILTSVSRRPVDIFQINLRPADFFTANPSIDVPSNKNTASQLVTTNGTTNGCCDS